MSLTSWEINMAHYDIDYSKMGDAEKAAAALRDIEEYLGTDRYYTVCEVMQEEIKCGLSSEAFELALSMAGIQGYPVRALWNHLSNGIERV